MASRALVLVGLVSACAFRAGSLSTGSDGGTNGGLDGQDVDAVVGDAPPVCASWHPQLFDPCTIGSPMGDVHLTSSGSPYTYDTTSEGGDLQDKDGALVVHSPLTLGQADGSSLALLSVASLEIDSGVVWNVIGSKPLLVASWSTIEIGGDLDAGSHTTEVDAGAHRWSSTQVGAGSDPTCAGFAATSGGDGAPSGGSGGGGGGAYHGAGGGGAVGDTGCTSGFVCPRPGGTGGIARSSTPTSIHGGCAGAASGKAGDGASSPSNANTVSDGGAGGGAIQLAAMTSITITGTVRAGGAGGAPAPQGSACGGGGGGAGGYVGLDAPSLVVSGTVAANGGGGGSSAAFAAHGNPGTDGQPSGTAAAGGPFSGGSCGLAGAPGSAGSQLAGSGASGNDACGGGGGGGGAGFVVFWASQISKSGATISPTAITP